MGLASPWLTLTTPPRFKLSKFLNTADEPVTLHSFIFFIAVAAAYDSNLSRNSIGALNLKTFLYNLPILCRIVQPTEKLITRLVVRDCITVEQSRRIAKAADGPTELLKIMQTRSREAYERFITYLDEMGQHAAALPLRTYSGSISSWIQW